MVKLLLFIANWLDQRFPEKVQVNVSDYKSLVEKLETVHMNVSGLLSRMDNVENTAVHKGAVSDLVQVVKTLKEEVQAMKFGIGMASSVKPEEVLANLNGEPIVGGH